MADRRAALAVLALLAVLVTASSASAQLPPDAAFRQFETEHFVVVFPETLESLARRAAARAEWLHGRLAAEFLEPPRGRIYLVLADNLDFAQGLASTIPWNRVVLYAAPPLPNAEIEFTDDWLTMAAAHELAHVFHLDRAGGVWSLSRGLLGRGLLGFPALFQPTWVKEGIAVYFESSLTGAGRLEGSYHAMLLHGAARDGSLQPIHDANGLSPSWPAGRTPYAYGSRFLAWHADTAGGRALGAFVREADGNLWGLGLDGDARKAFGAGFKAGWAEWSETLRRDARTFASAEPLAADRGDARIATLAGPAYSIARPRFDPSGRRIAFELYDGRGDRVTRIVSLDGGVLREHRRNSPGAHAWARDGRTLTYDQLEAEGRYALRSDLFALDVATGRERRLTRGARLRSADTGPAGDWIAVEMVAGTNRLVRVRPGAGARAGVAPLTETDLEVQWLDPRRSPDGTRIAAARWTRGGFLDVVLLDASGRVERSLSRDRAVDDAPAWSPDGRYLLWSSDRGGIRNVWALDLTSDKKAPAIYRVTDEPGGAFDPDVSPDGTRLAYVAHTGAGFVLRVVPYDPFSWSRTPLRPGPENPAAATHSETAGGPARAYSPWRSLVPTSWLPLWTESNATQGVFLGPYIAGSDVVGRHAYAAVVAVSTRTADVEAAFAYHYLGLGNPGLGLEMERDWSVPFAVADSTGSSEVLEREHSVEIAAQWLWPRFRHAESLEWSLEVRRRDLRPADPAFTLPASVRPTLTEYGSELRLDVTTARAYPYSISSERGSRATVRVRGFRVAEDPRLWFASARAVARAYWPLRVFGFASHVVAIRAAGAGSIYDGRREIFALGGVPGTFDSPIPGVSLGDGADYPVRGFDEGLLTGDRILAGSLEYRFPLALLTHGLGLTPVYFDRLSASLFVDGGSAWRPGATTGRSLASAGAEVALDLVLSHSFPYRIRGGVARRLSAPAGVPLGWELHASLGPAF